MEHQNAIALTFLKPALSPLQLIQLYQATGSATEIMDNRNNLCDVIPSINPKIINIITNSYDDAMKRAEEEMEFCSKHLINVLIPSDEGYPYRLSNCDDAPLVLYYRGTADLNAKHIVNIIGTRQCTVYGQDIIQNFITDLKKEVPDTVIVSGLAYGVDVNAHRNALRNGMETIGVIAHGMDTIYPSVHREIAKQMVSQGGLLTEYPQKSFIDKRNFLQRNRIVAGVSDACILPESAAHGGGLVTCRLSYDYGRPVFAFPGPVNAKYSQGCNNLIRDNGAQLITCAKDFILHMGWENDKILTERQHNCIELPLFPELNPTEQTIVDILKEKGDLTPDQLVESSNLHISVIKSTLLMLEMNGIIRMISGGAAHLNQKNI